VRRSCPAWDRRATGEKNKKEQKTEKIFRKKLKKKEGKLSLKTASGYPVGVHFPRQPAQYQVCKGRSHNEDLHKAFFVQPSSILASKTPHFDGALNHFP
jgi:hypothetical protein